MICDATRVILISIHYDLLVVFLVLIEWHGHLVCHILFESLLAPLSTIRVTSCSIAPPFLKWQAPRHFVLAPVTIVDFWV